MSDSLEMLDELIDKIPKDTKYIIPNMEELCRLMDHAGITDQEKRIKIMQKWTEDMRKFIGDKESI